MLAAIARELCLDKRVVSKWFWDKRRHHAREMRANTLRTTDQKEKSQSASKKSEIAISMLKKVKRDEFDQKREVNTQHCDEALAGEIDEVEDSMQRSFQTCHSILGSNKFIEVDDGIQELADELGLPIS